MHKRFTKHSEEVINEIISLSQQGMRSKDISLQSAEIFGYKIKQSTISNILSRNGVDAKNNTFRVRKRKRSRSTPLQETYEE